MFIRFFKTSYPPQYAVLVLLALAVWLPAFLQPERFHETVDSVTSPGEALLNKLFAGRTLIRNLVAFLFVLSGAVLLNFILELYDLVPRNTLIPALVFMLFLSHQPALLTLQPAAIALLLVLLMLYFLLGIYNLAEAYNPVFNAGLLIGTATLFYPSAVLFMVYLWLTWIVFRIYHWREWLIPWLGLFTLFLFAGFYYFWFDRIPELVGFYENFTVIFHFINLKEPFQGLNLTAGILIGLLSAWSLIRATSGYNEKVLAVRKRIGSLLWFCVINVVIFLFPAEGAGSQKLFLLAGVAIFCGIGLANLKRTFWFEIYLAVLVTVILINNYLSIL